MPNPNPKRYTRVVSVPLTDDQAARLDAGVGAGATRSDLIRAAIDAHLDESPSVHTPPSPGLPDIEQALERVLARHGIGSDKKPSPGRFASAADMKALRGRLSGGAQPEVQPEVQQQENRAEIPEGWAPATVNSGALARLQEREVSDLGSALAVVLRAAESGDLAREDIAVIVAARWDLKPGDRLHYDDGQLYRETVPAPASKPRPRRSVEHRAG